MPLELVTVPRVPILRTGHYDLQSGPADFSAEHLHAAVAAFENDPAVLAPRVRLELADQGHLEADGITAEAAGSLGGPAVGWADALTVEGNTLYADLHVPAIVAGAMEWAFPGRSIEGLWNYTTATGQSHDFMATGLLLLGTSWPGVTTLPDFHEVQAEFAADVADGSIDFPSFATAGLAPQTSTDDAPAREALERSAIVARMAPVGRPPQGVAAGLNVSDLRYRWYSAERDGDLDGLPDSYNYSSWYVSEVRADDDGTLFVLIYDEDTGQEWRFDVTSTEGSTVTFAEPYEVVRQFVRAAAATARPAPAIARWGSRADSRPATASASADHNQEDDRPMTDDERRNLATRLGLDPETATEADVHAAAAAPAEPPEPSGTGEGETAPEGGDAAPAPELATANGRTVVVSREVFEQTQRDAQAGAAARAAQIAAERTDLVRAAVADGRITPAEAGLELTSDGQWPDGWRRDMDEAPEVTARGLARLEAGKYPGVGAGSGRVPQQNTSNGGSLSRALAASGLAPQQKGGEAK